MKDAATVSEALHQHYASSGLPLGGGLEARRWLPLKYWPRALALRNFQWRRRALTHHDVHHVLTGYPCNAAGELEIAAWEFAAGRFPSVCSTLFCLPLVGLGAMVIPERSFAAFVRGRHSRTLYATPLTDELLSLPIQELRYRVLPGQHVEPTLCDCIDYLVLIVVSFAIVIVPFLLLCGLFLVQ